MNYPKNFLIKKKILRAEFINAYFIAKNNLPFTTFDK